MLINRHKNNNYLRNFEINYTEKNKNGSPIKSYVKYQRNIILEKEIKSVSFFVEFCNDQVKDTYITNLTEQYSADTSTHLQTLVLVKNLHDNGKYKKDDIEQMSRNKYLFNFSSIEKDIDDGCKCISDTINYKDTQFLVTYANYLKMIIIQAIKSKEEFKKEDIIFAIPNKMNISGKYKEVTYSDEVIKDKEHWTIFKYNRG